jgi:hypothetical protein
MCRSVDRAEAEGGGGASGSLFKASVCQMKKEKKKGKKNGKSEITGVKNLHLA